MYDPHVSRLNPSRYGLTDSQIADIKSTLEHVGFRDVETQQRVLRRETIMAILARHP
jgi:hypothetical protein